MYEASYEPMRDEHAIESDVSGQSIIIRYEWLSIRPIGTYRDLGFRN